MARHHPRCAIFRDPPSLREPRDCDCGAIPPLPRPDGPFTDNYRFTGPHVAISCTVDYDAEQERWIARGDSGMSGWTGFGRDEVSAALNCFRAWMLDEGGYHGSMVRPRAERKTGG